MEEFQHIFEQIDYIKSYNNDEQLEVELELLESELKFTFKRLQLELEQNNK